MTTIIKLNAFEEENPTENDKPQVHLYDGSTIRTNHTTSTNGTNTNGISRPGRKSKSRISKDTLFKLFVILLILALLIPILVLVALIYGQNRSDQSDDSIKRVSQGSALRSNPDTVTADDNGNSVKVSKSEPWRQNSSTIMSAWKQLANRLADSIDPTADACDDFYAYSCDEWKDRNPLNEQTEISQTSLAYDSIQDIILQTFSNISNDDKTWPLSVRWAKNFYYQCLKLDDSEIASRRRSIHEFLSNVFLIQTRKRIVRNASKENRKVEDDDNIQIGGEDDEKTGLKNSNKTQIRINILNATVEPDEIDDGSFDEGRNKNRTATVSTKRQFISTNTTPLNWTPYPFRPQPIDFTTSPSVENSDDIWGIAGSLSRIGVSSFFNIDYSKNSPSSLKTILHPPTLSLKSRKFYLEPVLWSKHASILEKSIIDNARFLQTPLFNPDQGAAQKILEFEKALAKASPTSNQHVDGSNDFDFDQLKARNPTAKKYSLSNLKSRWQQIDWLRFLPDQTKSRLSGSADRSINPLVSSIDQSRNRSTSRDQSMNGTESFDQSVNQSVSRDQSRKSIMDHDDDKSFFVVDPAYVDQLNGLLEDYDHATIMNYLKWRYILSVIDFISPQKDGDLIDTCYEAVQYNTPLVLAHILYKINYGITKEDKDKMIYTSESVQFVFNRTLQSLKSIIEFSNQMDNSSKKSIIDELSSRVLTLEWPDVVKDGKLLDNVVNDDNWMNKDNVTFIEKLNDLRADDFSDDMVNAWADVTPDIFITSRYIAGNTVAAVYSPAVLNAQLSQAAIGQFATIGWQLARELVKSIRYSSRSPLRNSKIDQCLINEYNRFCYQTSVNSCVDGAWTLEENFADTIALQAALKAYKWWESAAAMNGFIDPYPPFLATSNLGRFTLDQMFFLSYGTSFCYNANIENILNQLATDRLTPNDYRLRGTVENLDDFHLAFYCKTGHKMHINAKERCQI